MTSGACLRITGVLLAAVIATCCASPEREFRAAERANTESAYMDLIKRHPDSTLVSQAETQLHTLAYQEARRAGTSSAYQVFLQRFPSSTLAKQAQVELEKVEYETARRAGTSSTYQAFLQRFPSSGLAKQAQVDLATVEYDQARRTNTIAAYKTFTSRFPASELAKDATSAIAQMQQDEDLRDISAKLKSHFNGDDKNNVLKSVCGNAFVTWSKLRHYTAMMYPGATAVMQVGGPIPRGCTLTMQYITGPENTIARIAQMRFSEKAVIEFVNGNGYQYSNGKWLGRQ